MATSLFPGITPGSSSSCFFCSPSTPLQPCICRASMPGVDFWRWHFAFGSDDVLIPALVHAATRVALIIQVANVVYGIKHAPCADATTALFYVIFWVQLGCAVMGLVLSSITAWIASRGTILNTAPRKHMVPMLCADVTCMFLEVAFVTFATTRTVLSLQNLRNRGQLCEVHSYYLQVPCFMCAALLCACCPPPFHSPVGGGGGLCPKSSQG